MSTITRELAKLFRKITNSEIDAEGNAHVVLSPADSLLINNARIALASLEAEAVAEVCEGFTLRYIGHGPAPKSGVRIGDRLYIAPPAQVSAPDYPETLPCPVMLEPGLRFGKGVPTKTMLGALQRRAEHYAELEAMTPEQRAKHDAGMKEFASMLQGADSNSPDGWVACSERMPEDDDFVYIWPRPDFGVEMHVAQHGKFDKRDAGWYAQVYEQNYGIEYHPITVTHWMPLPAAPHQEVKP
ncbi:DUF551 domain-containing protein [Enterobacter hormaechei]|nr:DUF551 domain-containing protein [Enterobacter hormaechei]